MIDTLTTFWIDTFTDRLKTRTPLGDSLRMSVVKKAPFQDDPTVAVPYLILDIDEKGMQPEELVEIGGSVYWVAHLKLRAAPKVQAKVEDAYKQVDLLAQRIVWIIRDVALNSHPSDQMGMMMDNRDWFLFDIIKPKITGGDGEWQSRVDIHFRSRIREEGPYPYGQYPGILL